jgi:hypothetical protein
VFVASDRLYALAANCATRGGRCIPKWRSAAGPVAYSQPAVGAGLVAVASDRVEVYALQCSGDQASCPPIFAGSRITPGVPLSRPAIAAPGVFVASNDGRLIALQVPRSRSFPRP